MPAAAGRDLERPVVRRQIARPTPPFEFSARKVGKIWEGLRSLSFSIATTLPMFGAMLPSAAAGLRPICIQVCASECTSACERMERTMAKSPVSVASFGSRPVGKRMPLTVSGLESVAGVTPLTS